MIKRILPMLIVGLMAQLASAAPALKYVTIGSGASSWQLFILPDAGSGDVIQLSSGNWSENYQMSQKDVSPSMFTLTYNTLKDAFIRADVLSLEINYDGGKLINARLHHK